MEADCKLQIAVAVKVVGLVVVEASGVVEVLVAEIPETEVLNLVRPDLEDWP